MAASRARADGAARIAPIRTPGARRACSPRARAPRGAALTALSLATLLSAGPHRAPRTV